MGITTTLRYAAVRPPGDDQGCGYVFGVFMMRADAEYALSTLLEGIPSIVVELDDPVVVTVEVP